MPTNPMQALEDATSTIEARKKRRENMAVDHRSFVALEALADEVTMMRAEMTVMRGLMAMMAAPKPGR
ncbi:MAG: hypothetical protein JWQ01_4926 [Massilia sp.]|nr:hypothetical protein [Massilia sp.]